MLKSPSTIIFAPLLLCWPVWGSAAEESPAGTAVVRGFVGNPVGGFQRTWPHSNGPWPTRRLPVTIFGVRQQKDVNQLEWKSAPLPATLTADTVTFVWSGAMGFDAPWNRGTFTIAVNGHDVAEFDVVRESTKFPCLAEGCRFLYQVLSTNSEFEPRWPLDSSGYFFLTVPRLWLKLGQPATLRVTGKDSGSASWFALIHADHLPSTVPEQFWKPSLRPELVAAGTPPPTGTEASYEWYAKQYEDPGIFMPIGPPADPAETAVSPHGQLMYANERLIAGTAYVANALVFGLYDGGRVVPIGLDAPAHQVLADGYLPIVTTRWRYRDLDVAETAFARPLRGPGYTTGLESTLAWAVFDITNRTAAPREITFLAAQGGNEKKPNRELICRDGVVLENGSARLSARPAEGFTLEFKPVFPESADSAARSHSTCFDRGAS